MSITSFSAEQISATSIRVSAAGNMGGILVEVDYDGNGNWGSLGTIPMEGGTVDDSVSPPVTRNYRATEDGGMSYEYTSAGAIPAPESPPTVSASIDNAGLISIGWDGPAYATHITLYREDVAGGGGPVVKYSGVIDVFSLEDTGVKIGRVYRYWAACSNQWGSSPSNSPYAYGCRPLLAENSPDPADVRDGIPCLSADLVSVVSGTLPAAQEPGDEYVLKADVVAAANVLLDVPRWAGATGADKGTVRLPGEARVEDEYDYGPSDSMQGTLVPAPGPAPDDAWAIPKKAIWTEQLKSMPLMVYQHARFRFLFTLVDGEDAPINVDGKLCSFVVFNAAGAAVYQIDGLPVTANTIYVSGADTRTATAATHNWVLRNDTDDVVLARGTIVVQAAADRTP